MFSSREYAFALAIVLIISWLAFGWRVASTGLVDETEPLFAEAARGMYQTGDWITPYFNGETRFDKPPLVYWLMAIGFHLFGVSEWTVRLPSVLAASGLTGLGFYTLRRFGFPRPQGAWQPNFRTFWIAAIVGAAAIALHPETIVWARIGVSDMLLSGCIGAALLSFFIGYAQPEMPQRQARWYIAFYVFMALAVLDKGPVGVVLPGLTVIVFAVYVGKVRELLREIQLVKGSLLFGVIAVPWFVLVTMANGQAYIDSFFGYHNFDRFTDVVNGHAAPWFFYFLVVFIGFLPWSPFLPYA
ncbi:MAG: glycosyltransferase family 39 protein, partial [Cyanobacteria bacterium P01_G01_bin.38]